MKLKQLFKLPVTEAATNWEFVVVAVLERVTADSVSSIWPAVVTGQGHIREVSGGVSSSKKGRSLIHPYILLSGLLT